VFKLGILIFHPHFPNGVGVGGGGGGNNNNNNNIY
jgi:hypothetical protein